ncbi:DUF1295 domain-containing protein [candidate division WWE3 bacterium]|nr:DUF1295 domain-containing protein [candidate division WWE3 bacterium]
MLIETLLQAFILIFAIQVAFFILAYTLKTDKFTDFAYGASFIITAFFVLIKTHQPLFSLPKIPLAKFLILAMVTLWGVRLATYLLIRILKTKKDKRFDKIREDFLKFAGFWFLQAISIWMISLPVMVLLNVPPANNEVLQPNILSILGFVVWLAGFLTEAIADQQKFEFLNKKANKGRWVNVGLWKYSRHPNYFGEILCWIGVFVFAMSFLGPDYFYIAASPLYITALLLFVSGLPPAEKSMEEKFAGIPAYEQYKDETSVLVPLPKRG